MHNIFAYTEATPEADTGLCVDQPRRPRRHTITVRSRGNGGLDVATIEVSELVLTRMAVSLMDPRKRIGYGGASGKTLRDIGFYQWRSEHAAAIVATCLTSTITKTT